MSEINITPGHNTPKVQLGCGTLILIAIIVILFSGDRSDRKLRNEIRQLRETVERLEKKIDALQPPAPTTTAK
jgi:Sec-independent protein translocase protein TatA